MGNLCHKKRIAFPSKFFPFQQEANMHPLDFMCVQNKEKSALCRLNITIRRDPKHAFILGTPGGVGSVTFGHCESEALQLF
jgi:hypothetical protein